MKCIRNTFLCASREDRLGWGPDGDPYLVSDGYNFLEKVQNPDMDQTIPNVWKMKGAPKHQMLMWLACLDKVIAKAHLVRIGILNERDVFCLSCGEIESDSNHILLTCRHAWLC